MVYMVTWIPSIYPLYVSIYTIHGSVMGYTILYNHPLIDGIHYDYSTMMIFPLTPLGGELPTWLVVVG